MGSFAKANYSNFIIPKVNRLVGENREQPTIGAQRNRGFQDVIEEVSEEDGDAEGAEGAFPPRGRSKLMAEGLPKFVRFLSIRLAAPHGHVPFFAIRGDRRYVGVFDIGIRRR